jgi:hypothetical protein
MNSLQTVKLSEIREVWESFTGWYWFVTEYHEGTLAFGLVRGWETEWGYFDLNELRQLEQQCKVWKVPKQNWAYCPCVKDDAALYLLHQSTPIQGEMEFERMRIQIPGWGIASASRMSLIRSLGCNKSRHLAGWTGRSPRRW